MSHRALILDDDTFLAQAARSSVESEDRDVGPIEPVHTVADAKEQFERHPGEFVYAIVDMDMGNVPADQQGEAFLDWLFERGELTRISVLAISSYEDRLGNLPRKVSRHIKRFNRTASDDDFDHALRQFVKEALERARPDTPR